MKKIFVIFTVILSVLVLNIQVVDAAGSCTATLSDTPIRASGLNSTTKIWFPEGSRTGYVYLASLTGNGKRSVALCIDRGKRAGTAYKRSEASEKNLANYLTRPNVRKAYAMAQSALSGGMGYSGNEIRYYIAQAIIWYEFEGVSTETYVRSLIYDLVSQLYSNAPPKTVLDDITNGMYNQWKSQSQYSGKLYVYESITSSGSYQRFITGLQLDVCPPGEVPEIPENPGDTPQACTGGVVKVAGASAVCANDNNVHSGSFYEYVDSNECGDADYEYGAPTGQKLGTFGQLYCLEQAVQSYPGGISTPLALGTSLIWPTSSATSKTVWGNLYPLSYRGVKTCKIRITGNPEQKVRDYFNSIQSSVSSYDSVRRNNNGNCGSVYDGQIASAQQDVNSKQNSYNSAVSVYNAAVNDYNAQNSACNSANSALQSCNNNVNACNSRYNACVNEWREKCRSLAGNAGNQTQTCIDSKCKRNCGGCSQQQQNANTTCGAVAQKQQTMNQKQQAMNSAKSSLDSANSRLNSLRSQKSACEDYMSKYRKAVEIIDSVSNVARHSFNVEDLYQFQSGTAISYNDPEYGATHVLNGNTGYSCTGCEGNTSFSQSYGLSLDPSQLIPTIQAMLRNITDRVVTVEANVTYTLPANLYYYADKRTNKPLMQPTGDYITLGYSNLPTSYNASTKKKYDLKVLVNSLGENGKFTELANATPYTCNYSVTNTTTDECVCPDGTKHAGEDLYCIIFNASKSETTLTCADAQTLYCNSDDQFDEYCTDDKFCPNDKSIKITSCIKNGYSYQYCVDNLCGITDDYHCPKGTYNDGMDIKPCVFANIDMGLEAALQYCKDTVCPYKGGINIIYRTISLRNPFPGKKAKGPTANFSLDNLQGRFPGANWNSKLLVRNQILYNRNVEGNSVYQKEPLYTFILDTATIKNIREYNNSREASGGYADFTLECNSQGVACKSNKFLRESNSGLVSGVCSSASNANFYACAES